jgi:hypothetical protein
MADPRVRPVGTLYDLDGLPVEVGIDHDAVTIKAGETLIRLDSSANEEFAQLYVSAVWQAARQAGEMAAEVDEADGGGTQAHAVFPIHARYAYPDNGWDGDQKTAAQALTVGEVYTVSSLHVGHSTSYLTFEGVEGRFNTVLFEPVMSYDDGPVFITVDDAPPHPPRTLADYEQAGGVLPDG